CRRQCRCPLLIHRNPTKNMKHGSSRWLGAAPLLLLALSACRKEGSGDASESSAASRNEIRPPATEQVFDSLADQEQRWQDHVNSVGSLPLEIGDKDLLRRLEMLEASAPDQGKEGLYVTINEIMEQLRLKGRGSA